CPPVILIVAKSPQRADDGRVRGGQVLLPQRQRLAQLSLDLGVIGTVPRCFHLAIQGVGLLQLDVGCKYGEQRPHHYDERGEPQTGRELEARHHAKCCERLGERVSVLSTRKRNDTSRPLSAYQSAVAAPSEKLLPPKNSRWPPI